MDKRSDKILWHLQWLKKHQVMSNFCKYNRRFRLHNQPNTCLKSTTETLEKGVKNNQS